MLGVDHLIQATEEGRGFEVLPPSIPIGDPLACLAAIVQVEHRRHGIHPETIHMELIEPEQGVGY